MSRMHQSTMFEVFADDEGVAVHHDTCREYLGGMGVRGRQLLRVWQ